MTSHRLTLTLAAVAFAFALCATPALAIDLGECNTACTPTCPCSIECDITPGNTVTCGQVQDWFGYPCLEGSSTAPLFEEIQTDAFPQVNGEQPPAALPETPAVVAETTED